MRAVATLKASATAAVKGSRWPTRVIRHNPVAQFPLARLARRYDVEPVARRSLRAEAVRRALRDAATTPYGRSLGLCDPQALSAWPILEKEELKADETRFHTAHRLPTVSAATSGTSGVPLRLRRSLFSLNAEQFFLDRQMATVGVSFATSRYAVLRGDDAKDLGDDAPPFGRYDHGGRRLVLSSAHLNAGSVRWYADELRRFAPDFLWVYPSTLSSLVRLIDEAGLELSVPLAVTSSESLFPNEAAAARRVLGASVLDYYGQAERVALAFGVDSGYRFEPLYGTTELSPVEVDDPPEEGLAAAAVLATGHWNAAMPLVRYATGDTIWYRPSSGGDPADQLARIAVGEESFVGIKGRSSSYLIDPDGGVLVGIGYLPRGLEGVLRMQVRQEALTEVKILVLTSGSGLSDGDRATLDATIKRKLPPSLTVRVEVVDELPRTASGKTPFVVRAPGLG